MTPQPAVKNALVPARITNERTLFRSDRPMIRFLTMSLAMSALLLSTSSIRADDADDAGIVFPADSGVVDVTKPPYNAKGDGITDDTDAIQRALRENPNRFEIIYLPDGTYLISKRLMWGGGPDPERPDPRHSDTAKLTTLQGQSRERTIIKLKNDCEGFQNAGNPQAMIWTGEAPAQRFLNYVRDLTIDTGENNPGAIGIQFMANNTGGMRQVTIKTEQPKPIGLDLGYTDEQGPMLISNVSVEGPFKLGISSKTGIASFSMSEVTVKGALTGWKNAGQSVAMEDYTYDGPGVGIDNASGFIVLVGGDIRTQADAAIINNGAMLARNVKTRGAEMALRNTDKQTRDTNPGVKESTIDEWTSNQPVTLWPVKKARTLGLPIEKTPQVRWEYDMSKWISPTQFGAIPDDGKDDSDAIQAAIDEAARTGATTLYFPRPNRDKWGTYHVSKTIRIHGSSLRRIIGCSAWLAPMDGFAHNPDNAMFRFEGDGPPLKLERLWVGGWSKRSFLFFDDAGDRDLIFEGTAVFGDGYTLFKSYRKTGGKPNKLYIEDSGPTGYAVFSKGQKVWARQFNPEQYKDVQTRVEGADFWCLGMKLEGSQTALKVSDGGRAEVLGTLFYPPVKIDPKLPMFIVDNAELSCSMGQVSFSGGPFKILVEETRNGKTRQMTEKDGRGWINAPAIILFTTGPGDGNAK